MCDNLIEAGRAEDCIWQPIIVAKDRIIRKYGSKDLAKKLNDYWDTYCYLGNYLTEYKKILEDIYKKVIRVQAASTTAAVAGFRGRCRRD